MRNDCLFRILCSARARGADEEQIAELAAYINDARCSPRVAAKWPSDRRGAATGCRP
ncbi:MAG: hypothetical protein HY721_17015 [Planctomycetes bacterium]|nr:hypothetical protein [Planctomycetota bacterium]